MVCGGCFTNSKKVLLLNIHEREFSLVTLALSSWLTLVGLLLSNDKESHLHLYVCLDEIKEEYQYLDGVLCQPIVGERRRGSD